jgi:hypothetical protein
METPNSPNPQIPSIPVLANRTLAHRVQPEPTISPGGHLLEARRKLIKSHPNKTSFLQNRLSRNYEIRQNALLLPAPAPNNQQVRPRIKKSRSKYASDAKLSEAAAIHRRKLRSEDVEFEVESARAARAAKELEKSINDMLIRDKAIQMIRKAVRRRTGLPEEEDSDEEEKEEMTYSSSSDEEEEDEEEVEDRAEILRSLSRTV